MSELNLKAEQNIESVEDFQFEPIKGQPMLNWRGKRPFTSTQFYPAEFKESYGEETNGWINKIFWGDNLQVMSHLLKQYRGQVDLIYIDPPFDSKADYKKKIELHGKKAENDKSAFEEKQYTDIWSNDEYLQFIYERLILMRELLSESGCIYLHCDWHKDHLLRCIMDEVFGAERALNEIIWEYQGSWVSPKNKFPYRSQTILLYSKTSQYNFNITYDEVVVEKGVYTRWKRFIVDNKIWGDNYPETDGKFEPYLNDFRKKFGRDPQKGDVIMEFNGSQAGTVWHISTVNPISPENIKYPTQKPETLLERIIKASSNPGDLVFDCFMGSGTTQAVSMKLGRRFIGADINLGSIDTTVKRLNKVAKEIKEEIPGEQTFYTGFEVYNVNNYDVFRNPIQAKDLLIEALELQPLPDNGLYDGEKDGRLVKIMPINRIATRADLNELITGFPRDKFDKRKAETPNKPVEYVTLVCMGHEPDLGANLKLQMKEEGYNIDVEVLDILRDKVNLEFRRDSEADVQIEGDRLVIREFFPMNLLQKLSMEKTNVEEWRELVDSIKIDFNFDGAVFSPSIIDIPEGNELVKGSYNIPADAGTIKVKITDLLSESCEVTLNA